MHLLDSLQVAHYPVRAGDTLALDAAVRVQVLSPTAPGTDPDNVNNNSVVLRIAYGETVLLFAGDVEAEAEREMLARYRALLPSDVVKVGHHGSSTSSTEAFARSVSPDSSAAALAVVSVARSNIFGLPDEEVLARWQEQGAGVRTTAEEGAVWIRTDGKHLTCVRWR